MLYLSTHIEFNKMRGYGYGCRVFAPKALSINKHGPVSIRDTAVYTGPGLLYEVF